MNELYLYGTVGESFWGEESFTPSMVREQLAQASGPLTVRINSGGGIAVDGQTIYNLLRDYPGEKTVVIDGIAASAASLIAMAGDRIIMRAGSILMVHDPAWTFTEGRGTEEDHLRAATTLGIVSNAYARVYGARAGISAEEARKIMKAETYFDGEAAVAAGFATETEEDEAQAVAMFDYRIYARAPERLLNAGASITRPRSREAVMAMILGMGAPKNGDVKMNKTLMESQPETDGDMEEDRDEVEAETVEEVEAEDVTDADDDEDADDDVTASATGKTAVQILDLCMTLGRDAKEARALIARGVTLQQAVDHFTAQGSKEKPMTANIRPGGPSARIIRDETETRRAGMTGALVAQMGRAREVTGPARDFMAMGIIDMAAASIGHKGPVRRGAGELRILEMALGAHSTSDFPAIFENALNKRLMAAYVAAQPTYRRIATRMDFTDFRPHPVSAGGDFPTLLPIGENGEIKFGSSADKKEVVALGSYGRAFSISRQMMINDDLGGIERLLSTRGRAVAAFEDAAFYKVMLSGANNDGPTLLETSRQVFNTTDTTKAGTAAAITVASLSIGRAAMKKKKGLGKDEADKLDLEISPSIILVGPDKETEAQQIIAPIQAQQAGNVNPFSGTLEIVTSNKITGNAWYLFADPSIAPVFMYGFLQGEEGPRMRMDEPFGSQGMAWSVELDFGAGAVDYRGGWKNAGA